MSVGKAKINAIMAYLDRHIKDGIDQITGQTHYKIVYEEFDKEHCWISEQIELWDKKIINLKLQLADLNKTIDAYRDVCNEYIPAEKLDEANNKVILLAVGEQEQIGRDLLRGEK